VRATQLSGIQQSQCTAQFNKSELKRAGGTFGGGNLNIDNPEIALSQSLGISTQANRKNGKWANQELSQIYEKEISEDGLELAESENMRPT